ncbi:MAG: hypothetical protein AB1609_12205 [Bacillota bacterium]
MQIAGHDFEGPYSVDSTVIPANRAAVYVIICAARDGKKYVIDVGESGEVGIRLANHERKPCWERNCDGTLQVYLRFMPTSLGYTPAQRRELEQKIRRQYKLPCGDK